MTVKALRRGRPAVLADLLARYGTEMQAVAYLIVRDRAAAEDILADSLLTALDQDGLRDDAACGPGCCGSRRTRRSAIGSAPRASSNSGWGGPRRRDPGSRRRGIARSLAGGRRAAAADARSRRPPVLPGPAVETVAEILDVSPNTIKTQLKSALAHLRAALPTSRRSSRRCDMRELDDATLELQLRRVLNERLGRLPLELTAETLERRRATRDQVRRRRRIVLDLGLAAALVLRSDGSRPVAWCLARLPHLSSPTRRHHRRRRP